MTFPRTTPVILLACLFLSTFSALGQPGTATVEVRVSASDDSAWTALGSYRSAEETEAEASALAEALAQYRAPEFPLTQFSGEFATNGLAINWTAATPRQGFRTYIQRSPDGEIWSEVGTLVGSPEQMPLQDWQFVDPQPLAGPNYYRLRQVTADGRSVMSDIMVIEPCPGGHHVTYLYPYPGIFGTQIDLHLNSPQPVSVKVYNEAGEQVANVFHEAARAGDHRIEVEVTDFEPGKYVCQIRVGNQISQRVIKR